MDSTLSLFPSGHASVDVYNAEGRMVKTAGTLHPGLDLASSLCASGHAIVGLYNAEGCVLFCLLPVFVYDASLHTPLRKAA